MIHEIRHNNFKLRIWTTDTGGFIQFKVYSGDKDITKKLTQPMYRRFNMICREYIENLNPH